MSLNGNSCKKSIIVIVIAENWVATPFKANFKVPDLKSHYLASVKDFR